jgi:hypothetical protein
MMTNLLIKRLPAIIADDEEFDNESLLTEGQSFMII